MKYYTSVYCWKVYHDKKMISQSKGQSYDLSGEANDEVDFINLVLEFIKIDMEINGYYYEKFDVKTEPDYDEESYIDVITGKSQEEMDEENEDN